MQILAASSNAQATVSSVPIHLVKMVNTWGPFAGAVK